MILPVVLCGGSGSRLWPLSRKNYPKQLLSLSGTDSLLQETAKRLTSIPGILSPTVICNEAYRFIIAEQLRSLAIDDAHIILEPYAKNTAPAAAIAAFATEKDTLLLVLPADHQIKALAPFLSAVEKARKLAEAGFLVTFGVYPERPETGYGYIKKGNEINQEGYRAEAFVEKPDLATAKEYLASKDYYWNSGMFMFQASTYLDELERFSPDIIHACKKSLEKAKTDLHFIRLDQESFAACPSDSIDYAVMEKSQKVAVVPLQDSGWSDLGSWDAIFEANEKDGSNNVIKGDVCVENVSNSYLHAQDRLLAVVGVSDHIVIETADAVLVAHKDASQEVKQIVKRLENKKRDEVDNHRLVYRPWGHYQVLEKSSQFQVKCIVVKPGASLSLQKHRHRSEHWVVIKGEAEVTCGDKQFTLLANQSTYIPAEHKHRLRNKSNENVMLIEVQTGSYLGEDDIIRFEDVYGREVELA